MELSLEPTFGTVDYIVFILVLLVSMAIGVYASMKGNRSSEDFLMGNRDFGYLPVAMSLLTSFVSAISLLGYSGEAYAHGIQMYIFIIGVSFGIWAVSYITLPVLFPLKLTSVNEYIELRFHSSRLRKAILFINIIQNCLYMGVCLYAPTIALATVTPLSSMTYIFILGGVVTLYSSIGGIRAVIWTDVFQLIVMVIGVIGIFFAGLMNAGGFTRVWNIGIEGKRLTDFNLNPSIYERHNIYNTFAFGLFLFTSVYGTSQINVQRLCAVRTLQDGKKILIFNAVGMILLYIFIFGQGVISYAAYFGCDPLKSGVIKIKEEITPYFIVDRLSFITGLPGVFVATLIGGALSSLSSVMNALVAMLWKDLCCNWKIFRDVKPTTASVINKIFTLIIGVIIIGTAMLATFSTSLIKFTLSISGVLLGGIFGVFLFGLLFPMVNIKGAWSGMIFSCILMSWISAGNFFHGKKTSQLPFSIDNCSFVHFNSSNITSDKIYEVSQIPIERVPVQEVAVTESFNQTEEELYMSYLYDISYTLYPVIGTCSCLIVGFIVSFITGNSDIKTVDPKYVSPFMRKFYWTEDELKTFSPPEKVLCPQNSEKCGKKATVLPLTYKKFVK